MITEFDRTDVYEKELLPMVDALDRLCKINGIPFFFSCCVKNDETGSGYKHAGAYPDTLGLGLKNDLIPGYVNVSLGFDTVFKQNSIGGDIDDLMQETGYTVVTPGKGKDDDLTT